MQNDLYDIKVLRRTTLSGLVVLRKIIMKPKRSGGWDITFDINPERIWILKP